MNVKLLYYTPDPERVVATAARLCYSSLDANELTETLTQEQILKLLNIVIKGGHHSTLEHVSFTFSISEVSRALTHQLVRHRIASYNQQSQRYVKFDNSNMDAIIPPKILNDMESFSLVDKCLITCFETYTKLLELGLPAEDARYILPNACTTNIIVTMNGRELYHFFNVRCCNRAQWEIRILAWNMMNEVKAVAPNLFAYCGPNCMIDKCKEGKMSCGDPYLKVES